LTPGNFPFPGNERGLGFPPFNFLKASFCKGRHGGFQGDLSRSEKWPFSKNERVRGFGSAFPGIDARNLRKGVATMRKGIGVGLAIVFFFCPWTAQAQVQQPTAAQKRILIERGEKVTGKRLELVKKVIESYRDCEVQVQGKELTGLRINGKLYSDFTLVVRDAKKTIIVVTPDGVFSFDY
jgi:hypothetical protein